MSNADEISTKIKEMAKMSVLSNKINEIQEKNLKLYPLVFFDGIKSVKIEYDLSHSKSLTAGEVPKDTPEAAFSLVNYLNNPVIANNFVSYYLEIDETIENAHKEKRFAAIEKAVRDLFWGNVSVEVYFNDKIVFKSKK